MLSKITRGSQVTIPKPIMERIGLKAGCDYVDIEYRQGIVYLKPVDIQERIPKEEWEKLKRKALTRERGDITLSTEEAEGFLDRRAKRHKPQK